MTASGFERFPRLISSLDELPCQTAALFAGRLQPEEQLVQAMIAPRLPLLGRRRNWRARLRQLLPWEWSPEWAIVLTQQRLLLAATPAPGASARTGCHARIDRHRAG